MPARDKDRARGLGLRVARELVLVRVLVWVAKGGTKWCSVHSLKSGRARRQTATSLVLGWLCD